MVKVNMKTFEQSFSIFLSNYFFYFFKSLYITVWLLQRKIINFNYTTIYVKLSSVESCLKCYCATRCVGDTAKCSIALPPLPSCWRQRLVIPSKKWSRVHRYRRCTFGHRGSNSTIFLVRNYGLLNDLCPTLCFTSPRDCWLLRRSKFEKTF